MGRTMISVLPVLLLSALVTPTVQNTYYDNSGPSCKIIGDPDTYGIGVRLSFYLNWGAACLALMFNLYDEHRSVRRAINAVAIAVITNTLISTTEGSFANLEWYIVFSMVLFLPFFAAFPFSFAHMKRDCLGIGVLVLLYAIFLVLQPWLYFVIPRQGYKAGCPVKVFLYTPIDMYNVHWVGFTKASAILGCISGAVLICASLWCIGWGAFAGLTGRYADVNDDAEDDTNDLVKIGLYCMKFYILLAGVSSIAFIEETIKVNKIYMGGTGFNSASQLIPFLVGVFSIVNVVWAAMKKFIAS